MARVAVLSVLAATAGVTSLVLSVAPAWASHFRAAQLSWGRLYATTRTVSFDATETFRRDYGQWTQYVPNGGGRLSAPNVGDVVVDANTQIDFGDGTVIQPWLQVTSVNAAIDVMTVQAVSDSSGHDYLPSHTYASAGVYTASITGYARLDGPNDSPPGGHMNNPSKSMRVSTVVNLAGSDLSSVESSLPPIVDCPRNAPCNFTIPASAPPGDTVSYRLASATEAVDLADWPGTGTFTQPTGAAVNNSGVFTWNTSGQPLAPSPYDTYYSAQVIVSATNAAGTMSSVAVDFLMRISSQQDIAPRWSSTTPADGTIVDATPGQPVTVNVGASDPDAAASVTLGVLNKPADATFTTAGIDPATGTFTWTPAAEGDTVLNFTATDQYGLGAVPRSVTIHTTKKSPTISWATPPSLVYGTALDGTQLDASLSTAPGTLTPPHPGTLTYTPAAGAVLGGGDNTLSVTWTPDPADTSGWKSVTSTVTLHVNPAGQTLSFDPAIDDTLTHNFGDAPFGVTAVSSAGLPVSYGVGTTDACTSTPQNDGSTQVAITAAGACTLTADQAGDANYSAAPQLSHSFTFAKQTPTIALIPADTTYGTALGSAQLDATVAPADAASNGSVSYLLDGAALPANGIVPAGEHTLTATYTPDPATGGNYNAASASATLHVAQAPQSITFGPLAGKTVGDPQFPVSASSDSGLAVTFGSATSDVCSVTATGTVSILHAGTCTLTADQAGDNNYLAAARVSQTFTIAKAAQTISYTTPGDQTYGGAAVPLTATGGASGNPVTFVALPVTVCGLDGANNLVINGAGACTITASQDGNGDYNPAVDFIDSITIRKATPTVHWSTPAAITYGNRLGADQLNATVQPASIAGDFVYTLADGTPAAGATLHASSTPQTLHVTFTPTGGDEDNWNSASGSTTILVNKADQAITWTHVPTSATYGDAPFTVAATGGGSGNPVTFTAEPGSACTVSGATVTITAAGPCALRADQAGDGDYNAAPTATKSVTIAKQTPTIDWATPAHITYGTALGASQLNATVTPTEAASNGSLDYATDAASGDATGQVLHAGNHTLTATYTPATSGAGLNYTGATTTVTLTVDQAPQVITGFAAIGTHTYGDGPLTLSASGGASGKPVYFTVDPGSNCTTSGTHGTTLTLTGAGGCTVIAHQDGTSDYNPAPDVAQTFQIQQATQTITFDPLPNAHVGDPATTLSATGGGSGNPVTFSAGPAATCTATAAGVLTIAGPGTCSVTASQAGDSNYLAATPVTRSFTVAYRVCVLSDQSQPHQNGSTVPIKVTLCNAAGQSTASSAIVLHATGVDSGPATAPGSSQPGNNFRYTSGSGGSYQYNLQTTGLTSGTHRFTYTVAGDPTEHAVSVVIS